MTVAELIEQYNIERPNNLEDQIKISWLKSCEQMVINEIINSHDHDPMLNKELSLKVAGGTLYVSTAGTITEHMDTFGMDTELLVPIPYENVYMFFLDQKMAYNQNDTRRYNAAATQYNNALLVYKQFYNRSYNSVGAGKKTFRHSQL